MKYLFGDSTPSTLEINFIEFLRDAVDFGVQVLLAEQRIVQGREQTRTLEQATAAELERLQKLPASVTKALEGGTPGDADSATARCAAAISRSAADLVRAEAAALRAALEAAIGKRDAQAGQERERGVKALEALLLKHDLPDTTSELRLAMAGEAGYGCRLRMKTGVGLEALLDLEIPGGHLYERVVRVDRLTERLDVHAPEIGGWLHKEVKQKTQHLDKHHVVELAVGPRGGLLKLRMAADGTGSGFDVLFSKQAPHVRMVRAEQRSEAAEPPFDVEETDAEKLLALYDKLSAAAMELRGHRRKLVEARLEGEPLQTHPKPTLLVERLIAAIAPVVQEIAARSQSPGELVLRRLLGGDRREEIFLTKAELKLKLEPLTEANRVSFEPLWAPGLPSTPAKAEAPAAPAPTAAGEPLPVAPLPRAPATPAAESSLGDAFRRALHGATAQTEPPPAPAPSTFPKPPPPPPARAEAAGTIDLKRG